MVYFGEHSTADWGLKLYDFQLTQPEPRTLYVEVPFRDGTLDFSTALTDGLMRYKDRTLTMGFDFLGDWSQWLAAVSKISGALQGQKVHIRTDMDPDYYYVGRCVVSCAKESYALGTITVTATCEPYKYKLSPTVKEFDVSGSLSVTLPNDRMPVVPTVTTDAEMTLVYGESTIVFPAGTRRAPALLLLGGDNPLTLSGNGHIKFEYQEGAL